VDEKLKKRLIGAVVLVAVAAIVVPMLFNGGEETEMPTFGSNVPDKPDEQVQTIEVPLQVPPQEPLETRPITSQQEAEGYEAQVPATPVTPPVALVQEPEPEVVEPPAAPAPAVKPAPAPKPAATKTPTAKPTATTSSKKPASGWVVQLGSFGKSANALALRDKVRKKGYSAFVEQQKGASGTVYRVRVGPELKRENADALKAKLAKAGMKGVVMPHP